MNIPIKTDGKIYLDLEIDPRTAYNILCRECIENGKFSIEKLNDSENIEMLNSFTTIRDKYSKVFGKDGEEALIPVKGYFDSEKNSFFITSNEVIKGLFHVFKFKGKYVHASYSGIWDYYNDDHPVLLYKGQDALDVYDAMQYLKMFYDKFVQENNKTVGDVIK